MSQPHIEIAREEKKWRVAFLAALIAHDLEVTRADAVAAAFDLVDEVERQMAERWRREREAQR